MKSPEIVVPLIVSWIKDYAEQARSKGFVLGVSGGIDSALTSTLCAMTGLPVITLGMHINQAPDQQSRSNRHIAWLKEREDHAVGRKAQVTSHELDLTDSFKTMQQTVQPFIEDGEFGLAMANTRSRLRAVCLYTFANARNYLVAGTGNKVEDYGVGFFTKYGDGAVDFSPIADLTKTEVRACARFLGILDEIVDATPTDGLWGDNRSDEDQIGATYEELEWALAYHDVQTSEDTDSNGNFGLDIDYFVKSARDDSDVTNRQAQVLEIYLARHYGNAHKLSAPPTCIFNEDGTALASE